MPLKKAANLTFNRDNTSGKQRSKTVLFDSVIVDPNERIRPNLRTGGGGLEYYYRFIVLCLSPSVDIDKFVVS